MGMKLIALLLIGFATFVAIGLILYYTGGPIWQWIGARFPRRQQAGGTTGTATTPAPSPPPPPYYKAHPWKAIGWVVLLILLAPAILQLAWQVVLPFVGRTYKTTWTKPPSQWGEIFTGSNETVIITAPQEKSVGGPLRWSENAKVNLRPRIVREPVDEKGVYFAGVMAPRTWADRRFAAFHEQGDWEAYLIDYTTANRFLKAEFLETHGTTKKDVPVCIIRLPKLSSIACEETLYLRNDTGLKADNPPVILEHYLQASGNFPSEIKIETLKETAKVSEYELEIGAETTEITLPQSFQRMWIAPVHHVGYQSYFLQRNVPASGISYEEALAAVQEAAQEIEPDLQEYLQLQAKKFQEDLPFQAILLERNGQTSVLSEALLLQQTETSGDPISLRLNVPKDKAVSRVIKPAKIIVGIQL